VTVAIPYCFSSAVSVGYYMVEPVVLALKRPYSFMYVLVGSSSIT